MLGGDHSTAGAIIGGTLRREGYHGLVRYAAEGRPDVSITAREYRDLAVNGIPVGIVVEHEDNWLLRDGVRARVAGARNVWRAAGVPDGVTWMACDFDVTEGGPTSPGSRGDRNMREVAYALLEAAGVIGPGNVGFYGSAYAIDWLVEHLPWLRWYWDTEGWSHGRKPHPHAQLYQRAISANIAGVDVDQDDILQANWGQRTHGPPLPAPPPPASGIARAELTFDLKSGHQDIRPLTGDVHLDLQNDRKARGEWTLDTRRGVWTTRPLPWLLPHPKVQAGGIASAGGIVANAILTAIGVHPSPELAGLITAIPGMLAAYLKR